MTVGQVRANPVDFWCFLLRAPSVEMATQAARGGVRGEERRGEETKFAVIGLNGLNLYLARARV